MMLRVERITYSGQPGDDIQQLAKDVAEKARSTDAVTYLRMNDQMLYVTGRTAENIIDEYHARTSR